MEKYKIELKCNAKAVIRPILMLTLFTAVLLFAKIPAFADSDTVLTVQKDGTTLEEFTLEELQQIAESEGDLTYNYSAWNTYPSFSTFERLQGPTVQGILKAADIKREDIGEKWVISFTDKEQGGYKASLTGKQLFEDRYYYPNGGLMDPVSGSITDEAYSDAVKVPAIVSIVKSSHNRLFVGQAAPNEENNPLFVKNLSVHGFIQISTNTAPQCKPVSADPESLTTWRAGKEITLTSANSYEYDKIYYTFDGSDPGYGCLIYNCGPGQELELKPVIPSGEKRAELKVVVKGYGKQDSDIQKFVYNVGEPLTVKVNGEVVKTYDRDELDGFAAADTGSGGLDYSGYNSYPSFQIRHTEKAYRVDSIIKDAAGKEALEFGSNSTVRFTGSDGYSTLFTIGQLLGTERYYYPNAEKGTDAKGGRALPAAYAGSSPVPAVIESSRESQLLFGQAAPNEQNHSEFVSYMLQGGTIEINDSPAGKCDPVSKTTPSAGSVVEKGEKINFPIPDQYKNRRDKLCFITDPKEGEVPGIGCDFYYYSPYYWPEENVNSPSFSTAGHHTIACRVCAYGRQDSEVTVLDYYVKPDAPKGLKATAGTYNSAILTWTAENGASGYRIYRSVSGGKLNGYRDIAAGQTSFTDTGLATGKTYSYAVSALAEGKNGTPESELSGSVSIKPALGKPAVKLKAGKKRIKVRWSKVDGASGYVVMRSTKKKSGYRAVKTIKKRSTLSFTNKKLKKGKRYYYKVRAYRIVNGKRIYGKYSGVKSSKAK